MLIVIVSDIRWSSAHFQFNFVVHIRKKVIEVTFLAQLVDPAVTKGDVIDSLACMWRKQFVYILYVCSPAEIYFLWTKYNHRLVIIMSQQ